MFQQSRQSTKISCSRALTLLQLKIAAYVKCFITDEMERVFFIKYCFFKNVGNEHTRRTHGREGGEALTGPKKYRRRLCLAFHVPSPPCYACIVLKSMGFRFVNL